MTTLTNDQITAGAAVKCDHGQPIGRNAAIAVFDAMQGALPAVTRLDLLSLIREHSHRCYAAGCNLAEIDPKYMQEIEDAARALAAPSPQIAEKVELPRYKLVPGETREWMLPSLEGYWCKYGDAINAIAASRRAPAPASAGQAAQPLPDVAMSEPIYQVRFEHQLAWNDASEDAYHTFRETSRRIVYLAAQPAEASAGQAAPALPDEIRALGWAVAVHNDYRLNGEAHTFWLFTKDGRAVKGEGRTDAEALAQVRAEIGIAAQPAEGAGQAGQVAKAWVTKRKDGSGYGAWVYASEAEAEREKADNEAGDPYEVVGMCEVAAPTERAAAPAEQPSAQVKP